MALTYNNNRDFETEHLKYIHKEYVISPLSKKQSQVWNRCEIDKNTDISGISGQDQVDLREMLFDNMHCAQW